MSRRSVQLNIRTAASVAEALREEALRRDVPLGEILEVLLLRARANTETGIWLSLPTEVATALRSVAAARGLEAEALLEQLLAGELRRQILEMAAGLGGPVQGLGEPLRPGRSDSALELRPEDGTGASGADQDDTQFTEEDEEEVGIFTVFD